MLEFSSAVAYCFSTSHDPELVVLAIVIAVLASFTALQVAKQVSDSGGISRLVWLAAASLSIGGGIWSMHFVAMLAFSLPIGIGYDISETLLSLAVAIVVAGIGLAMNARKDAGLAALLVGGTIMGLGVAAMHYSGMAAMRMAARIVYDPSIFALSVVIAVVAAIAALWLAFRTRGLIPTLAASLVMGAAISGMHFTGMSAASFVPTIDATPVAVDVLPRGGLAVMIAIGAGVILSIALAAVVVHRRFDALTRREALTLKHSEERLRALIENASDLIFLVDRRGQIVYAAAKRLGINSCQLKGWDFVSLFPSGERATLERALEELSTNGEGRVAGSARMLDAHGAQRDVDFVGNDLRDHPAIEGFVFTLYDVTQRAEAARAMARAHALAEHASQAKSQFITNMSHELRTPLNAVIGFADILTSEAFGPLGNTRYREYAEDIRSSGSHLLDVVNDILDIGRIEAGELTLLDDEVELSQLLDSARTAMMPTAEDRRIRIELEIPDQAILLGDPVKLRRILVNLLSNAVKFSHDGTRVLLSAHCRADGRLAIAVADQGIGISASNKERVWHPFFQADGSLSRRYEGSGLGLSIAKGLAELHGCDLELVSEPGIGTTVTLVLPAERVVEAQQLPIAAL